ncbi:MAG: hypothetical protein JNM47_03195 [Hyphomonadaceae bacterium]|nr:hypothetical protein [Hyphomonadaceae bacterium]
MTLDLTEADRGIFNLVLVLLVGGGGAIWGVHSLRNMQVSRSPSLRSSVLIVALLILGLGLRDFVLRQIELASLSRQFDNGEAVTVAGNAIFQRKSEGSNELVVGAQSFLLINQVIPSPDIVELADGRCVRLSYIAPDVIVQISRTDSCVETRRVD